MLSQDSVSLFAFFSSVSVIAKVLEENRWRSPSELVEDSLMRDFLQRYEQG